MTTYVKNQDGSIETDDGSVVFFSYERFVSEICEGSCCFLCGVDPSESEFNDEHIVPKWILRKLDLFSKSITLQNGAPIPYGQYTLRCCVECNSFLAREFEDEIGKVVTAGLDSVNNYVRSMGQEKLFVWLALIFFKTHLKDTKLRLHLDPRNGPEKISSLYGLGVLHHIHSLIRALRLGVEIRPECIGSMVILPAKNLEHDLNYDYRDASNANTILLRIGEVAFIAVLDDSGAAAYFFSEQFKRITGPLSSLQLREVLSHLTLINLKLKYRPTYYTLVNSYKNKVFLCAALPENMELEGFESEEFGDILFANVSSWMDIIESPDGEFNEKNIREGRYHFLFDENGKFISNSLESLTYVSNAP
jgi:hypothetical protein